ncbi:MAG: MerR family transcriptional regulator [Candidatus Scalindua sp.]|jgi:DNA-binding transcriptional MerR regulator|nr:MerR family transcriptional regulator [Candidatus Scalindua sp.]
MKTAGQLCRELGVKYYRLDYLIRSGYVPEPKRLDSGQRIFTDEDVVNIKDVICERMAK